MSDSTPSRRRREAERPKKPYPAFPLTPHPRRKWTKRIRRRIHSFGRGANRVSVKLVRIPGDGWEEALALYKWQADALHAGKTPRVPANELTVAGLANHYLTAKLRKREAGEINVRS